MLTDEELRWLRRRRRPEAPGTLLLAPLCTWFTLVLMYQFVVYDPSPYHWGSHVVLPVSTAEQALVPAVSLLVTKEAVLVDQKPVAHIVDGGLVGREDALAAVRHALQDRVTQIRYIHERGGFPFDGNLLVVADRDTPYGLLRALLTEAEHAEFDVFELVVQPA